MSKGYVWVVDDDSSIRWVMEKTLSSANIKCETFADAESVLMALERETPDVLVSDIRMPHMDGLSLLKEVSKKYPDVTRIILSNYLTREIVFQSTGLAHQYIHKGAENIELRAVLSQISELHQLIHEDKLKQ